MLPDHFLVRADVAVGMTVQVTTAVTAAQVDTTSRLRRAVVDPEKPHDVAGLWHEDRFAPKVTRLGARP